MNQNVIRNHKDSLFQLAFRDNPEAALSLYNAINGSHHTDATKLKFELLGGGNFMSMENDNGFEYSRAVTPQIRQAGNRLSGLAETAYASLLA